MRDAGSPCNTSTGDGDSIISREMTTGITDEYIIVENIVYISFHCEPLSSTEELVAVFSRDRPPHTGNLPLTACTGMTSYNAMFLMNEKLLSKSQFNCNLIPT